jgi:hypothetical protein
MASRKKATSLSWEGVMQIARSAGARYPELAAAQCALESGWFRHTSGKHNYLGIKGEGTVCATQEVLDGKTVTIEAEFKDFASAEECITYLVDRWYKDFGPYRGVNNSTSREAAALDLVNQSYATDPAYAQKLIDIMNEKCPKSTNPVTEVCTSVRPPLFTLKAIQATWLKKEPVRAAELGEKEKVIVPAGKVYGVASYAELPGDGHARVQLVADAGSWYVFESHWQRVQLGGEALTATIDWEDFDALVTANLTVGEIVQWDRRRIPATNSAARAWLVETAQAFQQIRDAWGAPLGVTSFYRPEPINTEVGGVSGSRHTTGEAMDIYPVGRSLEEFYQWIRVRWSGGLGDGRHRGFIHLDRRSRGGFVPGAGARPCTEWTY